MESPWKWMIPYLLVDFPNRVFYGIYATLFGPSQPYFAFVTQVDIDTLATIYSSNFVFTLIGTFMAAFSFQRYVTSMQRKMWFFFVCTLAMGLVSVLPPFCTSFFSLALAVGLRNFIGGLQETAAQVFLIQAMGPYESRSLVMAFHFTVAVGFWLGPFIITPFFPQSSSLTGDHICPANQSDLLRSSGLEVAPDQNLLQSLFWPYFIVAMGHVVYSFGYLAMILLPHKMPEHTDDSPVMDSKSSKDEWLSLVLTLVLFAATCGSERLFQAMGFTFGFCGPLRLPATEAVFTDKCYSGGFMLGRLLSMVVVLVISPKTMLVVSGLLCLMATSLISLEANEEVNYLYAGAALFGLAISWQYGAGVSWTAEHLDVIGWKTLIFGLGGGIGSAITPYLGGLLFTRVAPMALWHFNLICVMVQLASFFSLSYIYRKWQSGRGLHKDDLPVEYTALKQQSD